MTRNSTRRGAGRRVPLEREVASEEPISVTVLDAENEPVSGARVDALVCGWRSAPATGEGAFDSDPTVAYCQWAAGGHSDGEGVANLGPLEEWSVSTREEETTANYLPAGVDPLSPERIAASGTAGTRERLENASGTQILLLARYGGRDADWFGATRLPASRVVEYSELFGDGAGGSITLDRKLLWGPRRLTHTVDEGGGLAETDGAYQYGSVAMWQAVSTGGTHRLVVEVRAGFPTPVLSHPDQFPRIEGDLAPTVDIFDAGSKSHPQLAAPDGLVTGMLTVDVDEHPGPTRDRSLRFGASPVADGLGTERVRSYYPRVQPFADPAGYALSGAVLFELDRLPPRRAGRVPLYPGLRDTFEPWYPGASGGLDSRREVEGDDGSLFSARQKTEVTATIEGSKKFTKRANFSRGLTAAKGAGKAWTAFQGLTAVQDLLDPEVDELDHDFGDGPPYDPNRQDRLKVRWNFSAEADPRMAAVLDVPFEFAGGSEASVRLRGSWGCSLAIPGIVVRRRPHGRVNGELIGLSDRRVPVRDAGGRGGDGQT